MLKFRVKEFRVLGFNAQGFIDYEGSIGAWGLEWAFHRAPRPTNPRGASKPKPVRFRV